LSRASGADDFEGIALLNLIQDVDLDQTITVA
jgi:hypothetical protein